MTLASTPLACEWRDVQGPVASGYRRLAYARYLFFAVTNGRDARRWVNGLVPQVTCADAHQHRWAVNIAFSFNGLARVLEQPSTTLEDFSLAFQEGMAGGGHRARVLGDLGGHASDHWAWGGQGTAPTDIMLMVFAGSQPDLDTYVASLVRTASGVAEAGMLDTFRPSDREPFGFADGLSQPILEGTRAAREQADSLHLIRLGEVLLGYPDNANVIAPVPSVPGCGDFGLNGTYLVARQLAQDVEGFWAFVDRQCGAHGLTKVQLAEKMMGRTLDGDPLVAHRPQEQCAATNEFGFAEHDRHGDGCPIGSHIRRGNPRDSLGADPKDSWRDVNRHRILRRGRPYGAEGQPRGLMFIGLNADIERQFEFIQQNWINDAGFGELRRERDPIIGWRDPAGDDTFTIPRSPLRQRVHGMQSFVAPRGGGYFFMPGLRALAHLAQP